MEKELKHGDQARIAEITGFTHDYVKKVIRGRRKNAQIISVAEQLLADRARLASQSKAA
ncbi:hypothetical protein [Spirosoma lituiforme]